MNPNPTSSNHGILYALLVVLVALAAWVSLLHLSPGLNNLAVFGIAFTMAALVLAQYMGLRWEGPLVLWVFAIPVILFAILVVMLLPDIAHTPMPFRF